MTKQTNLHQCHGCGGMYPDSQMADWTICFDCVRLAREEESGEPVYVDQLGIAWTETELKEAGGIAEVDKMASDADARGKYVLPVVDEAIECQKK